MRITSNRTTFIGPAGGHVRSVPARADEETLQKSLTKRAVLPAGINELLQRRRFLMMESVLDGHAVNIREQTCFHSFNVAIRDDVWHQRRKFFEQYRKFNSGNALSDLRDHQYA